LEIHINIEKGFESIPNFFGALPGPILCWKVREVNPNWNDIHPLLTHIEHMSPFIKHNRRRIDTPRDIQNPYTYFCFLNLKRNHPQAIS
jgi:hypothetical protein